VLQHHNHASRDGVYVDAAMTPTAVENLHIDPSFANAQLAGPTYTQPLYLAGNGIQPDLVIVATEQNHVTAFHAQSAAVVWDVTLATPLPQAAVATLRSGCGNINPLGITGTPIIDEATRTIYLDAMTTTGTGSASAQAAAARHKVYALNADTGKTLDGWPVDLNSTAKSGSLTFNSLVQNQRGALALVNGKLFIPFGGHIGDCSTYHGWVIGIATTDPTQVSAWATRALAGGVWAPGGIASDGTSLYFATGNTEATADQFTAPSTWQDGETIFRLPTSLTFSNQPADYFVPSNWAEMDRADADLGGTAPVVFDLPGATPSKLVIGLGKDQRAFLLNRENLGGITDAMVTATVATGAIITASAAYTTPSGTFVAFKGNGRGCPSGQSGSVTGLKIGAGSPPTISVAWCGGPSSQGSVAVSVTDSSGANPLVWIVGSNNKLTALDGLTGQTVFNGGATADTMSAVQKFVPPIIANGRVFVGANNQLYAFTP
jgi:outer membrane protein assembly factor BamB